MLNLDDISEQLPDFIYGYSFPLMLSFLGCKFLEFGCLMYLIKNPIKKCPPLNHLVPIMDDSNAFNYVLHGQKLFDKQKVFRFEK